MLLGILFRVRLMVVLGLFLVLTLSACTASYTGAVMHDNLRIAGFVEDVQLQRSAPWRVSASTTIALQTLGAVTLSNERPLRRRLLALDELMIKEFSLRFPGTYPIAPISHQHGLSLAKERGAQILVVPTVYGYQERSNSWYELQQSYTPDKPSGGDDSLLIQFLIYDVATGHLIDRAQVLSQRGFAVMSWRYSVSDMYQQAVAAYLASLSGLHRRISQL